MKIICVISLLNVFSFALFAQSLGIVPRPKQVKVAPQQILSLDKSTVLLTDTQAKKSAEYLKEFLKKSTGKTLRVDGIGATAAKVIILKVDTKMDLKSDQGYQLSVNKSGVEITGKSHIGVFYGVQTLIQLLPPDIYKQDSSNKFSFKLPFVEIIDEPYFERIRGLHIDISRHFLDKKKILRIIDYIAFHKMNVLHMHLTDDPAWRIEIKAYPKLTEIGSKGNHNAYGKGPQQFLTQNDIKEIITYAKSQHIMVLPEVDMPGHMAAVIRAYPELKAKKDTRDIPRVLRIDEPGIKFCKTVLTEIRQLFGEVPIHIGCDEVNLKTKADIYSDAEILTFVKAMTNFIKEQLQTTPIVWDDAFEKGHHDKETLVHWWRPGKKAWWKKMQLTIDQKVQKFDQPFILSPGNYTYFDMKYDKKSPGGGWAGLISSQTVYNWRPLMDLVDADKSKRHLAQGIMAATWSERIPDFKTWQQRTFPRLAPLAERAWTRPADEDPNRPSWDAWKKKTLSTQLERYKAMGITYWEEKYK